VKAFDHFHGSVDLIIRKGFEKFLEDLK